MYHLFTKYILFICTLLAFQSCTGNPSDPLDPQNGTFGQEQITTETLTLNAKSGILLAGTDQGVFRKGLNANGEWQFSGLDFDSAKVIDFVIWNQNEIMAAVKYSDYQTEKPVLFKSHDSANIWNNIKAEHEREFFNVYGLEMDFENPDKLYAHTGYVSVSKNRGLKWNKIYLGGHLEFINASNFYPDIVYTGGRTTIFSPDLSKTEDGGETWTLLNENFWSGFNTETNIYDVVLDPRNPDNVLAGAGGAISRANVIRKSTDGGETWKTVIEGINTRTFTHSADNPEWVYASGCSANGSLFFVASGDFGESWEEISWEDSPAGVQVNDMVSVMEDGQEVLYFGTNQGVFSYRFSE